MNFKEFYETYWRRGGYASRVNPYTEYKKSYVNNIKLVNKRILDIGCGDGEFSSLLLRDNNRVFGVDISEHALKIANEKGMHTKSVDLNEGLPFEDGFFDTVLIFDILEHVFDPCYILKEAYRVLNVKGSLYCSVPNASMIVNRVRVLLTGDFKDYSAKSEKIVPDLFFPEHIRFFSPKVIKALLSQYNFSIDKTEYWFPDFFESPLYSKFNWVAKIISGFSLQRLFPGLLSFNIFITASKKRN
jgi:ubiquinone/menaquinone biosynthesis C-methylase UbiE